MPPSGFCRHPRGTQTHLQAHTRTYIKHKINTSLKTSTQPLLPDNQDILDHNSLFCTSKTILKYQNFNYFQFTNSFSRNITFESTETQLKLLRPAGVGEMDGLVKCSLHRHEDLSLTPSIYIKSQAWCCCWGGRNRKTCGAP